jgi:hypothetical protein
VSRWNGPAFEGARRVLRAAKRAEAERRNAATPPERRRQNRLACQRTMAAVIRGAAEFTAAIEQLTTATGLTRDQMLRLCDAIADEKGTPDAVPSGQD